MSSPRTAKSPSHSQLSQTSKPYNLHRQLSAVLETEEEESVQALGGISRVIKEYGSGLGCYFFAGTLGAMLNGAMMPAFFVFFSDLMNLGSGTEGDVDLKEHALTLMIKFLCIGVGFCVFTSAQYICFGKYSALISVNVRKAYFSLLLSQEIGYFDEKNSGALNTQLVSNCQHINGMGVAIGLLFQHFVTFLASFVLAFYYSWQLSLVLLAVVPVFIAVGVVAAGFEKQGTSVKDEGKKDSIDPVAAAGSFSNEVLLSIRSVKSAPKLLQSKLVEYEAKLVALIPAAKKQGLAVGIGFGGMMFAFFGLMYSIGYWYGGKLVDNGTISIGDMFLCTFALPIGAMSLGQMATASADVAKARSAVNTLFALKDRAPKMRSAEMNEEKKEEIAHLKGDIKFENVSFRYPTAPDTIVLDKVSFEIESGKSLAIVGPSGSGKSTVISLLERYYDPTNADGNIFIDGQKIHNFDITYLRKQIGFVPQIPVLFAESIKENIRGGNPNISDEDIIKAAKSADAHDFIMQLTEKYETNVGEMGGKLSGGQRQRIAIARAIVTNPSILLLDEATSALDTKSEREVQRAIDKISATHSKTVVVIAHRLSTIKNADQILVLVDGEVEERGDHTSLIQRNGVYAALVSEQTVTEQTVTDNASEAGDNTVDAPYISMDAIEDFEEQKDTLSSPLTSPKSMGRTSDAVTVTIDEKDAENGSKEEVVPNMGGTARLSKEYASDYRCLFVFANIFALASGVLFPVAYGYLFTEIITILTESIHCSFDAEFHAYDCVTNFEEEAAQLVIYWVSIGVYAFVCIGTQAYLFAIYGVKIQNRVKATWFEAVLKQDISYHDEQTSSVLNSTITVETQAIADGMGWKLGQVVSSISQILCGFIIAFYRSWRVSLVFLGLTPLIAVAGVLQSMLLGGASNANADPFLESGAVSQEILTNIRTILAFPYLITTKTQTFAEKVNVGLPIAIKRALAAGLVMGVQFCIMYGVMYGVGMYAGLRFVEKGWVTFDDVFGAFMGIAMGGMGIGTMGAHAPALKTANIAANKFFVARERKPAIKAPDDGREAISADTALQGSIEFKNISFAYASNPGQLVLNNVSFKVKAGSTLAIVGPSGSGKSTVISLIERFYDANKGEIILDETEAIHNYDLSYLRSNLGLVSQMPLLFDASISENIRGGNMEVKEEEIISAAKQANAHDFIMKFEDKYQTSVGELGGKLSGGQRQRIAIARALLNQPSILLLDEATSALDSKSEKEVQDAIDKISETGNQTVISIAHRLSTVKNCDLIIVLVDGSVRESGNHQSLMAENGVYSALVNAQTLVELKKLNISRQRSQSLIVEENGSN